MCAVSDRQGACDSEVAAAATALRHLCSVRLGDDGQGEAWRVERRFRLRVTEGSEINPSEVSGVLLRSTHARIHQRAGGSSASE